MASRLTGTLRMFLFRDGERGGEGGGGKGGVVCGPTCEVK